MRLGCLLLVIGLFYVLVAPAYAVNYPIAVQLDDSVDVLDVTKGMSYQSLSDATVTPVMLKAYASNASTWSTFPKAGLSFGFHDKPLLFMFALKDVTSFSVDWRLSVPNIYMNDNLQTYFLIDGVVERAIAEEGYHHQVYSLPVSIKGAKSVYVAIVVNEPRYFVRVPIEFHRKTDFDRHYYHENNTYLAFSGVIIAMILYNCYIGLRLRIKSYIYYAVMQSALLFSMMAGYGFGQAVFWDVSSYTNYLVWCFSSYLYFNSADSFQAAIAPYWLSSS